jgi:hypothetical protein
MHHFYDLEFLEDGTTIDLISIGIVSMDGGEYYAVNSDINTPMMQHWIGTHDFLAKHVVKHLPLTNDAAVAEQLERAKHSGRTEYFGIGAAWREEGSECLDWSLDLDDPDVKPRSVIADEVCQHFLDREDASKTRLWANYGAYDHVGLMQLWGPMVKRPPFLPMFTHDLQQFASFLGVSEKSFPAQETGQHDALADARHNREIFAYLESRCVNWQTD